MNIIQFKVTNDFYERIEIEIDGNPLVDIIRAIEIPIVEKEGSSHRAGDYRGIKLPTNPVDYFLGDEEYAYYGLEGENKTAMLACWGCGETGCWTVVCKIDVHEDTVRWSGFEHENQDHWDYSGFEGFVFSKTQYLDALQSIIDLQKKKLH